MLADKPINSLRRDEFGRRAFIYAVSDALCLPKGSDGFVIAVEGEWGSGKSSVLNMFEERIRSQHPEAIVVRFNPWMISGLDTLVEGFLVQLASAIGAASMSDVGTRAAAKVLVLGKLLAPIKLVPGVEPWGTLVENVLSSVGNATKATAELKKLDLQKRKKEVGASIKKLDLPIVVMIDDIDRLRSEEIRVIFQLVKAVGDFERTAYVLCYDPGPVCNALSDDGVQDGRAFLEKIVQVAYPLPRISYRQTKKFLEGQLKKFLKDYQVNLDPQESSRLSEALSSAGVTHLIRHPRDVIRLVNKLRISAVATKGEVNFADVVCFETLSIRYEHAARAIRKKPYDFIGYGQDEDDLRNIWEKFAEGDVKLSDKNLGKKSALLSLVSDPDKQAISALIEFLFPRFSGDSDRSATQDAEGDLRICCEEPLLKLLAVGQSEGFFSAVEIRNFLKKTTNRETILKDTLLNGQFANWVYAMANHVSNDRIVDPEGICELLMANLSRVLNPDSRAGANAVSTFVYALLSKMLDKNAKNAIFAKIASDIRCLSVSESLVLAAVREHGKWVRELGREDSSGKKVIEDWLLVDQGRNAWLEAVRRKSKNVDEFMNEPMILGILYRWGQFMNNDFQQVKIFTAALISKRHGVERFVALFPESVGVNGVEQIVDVNLVYGRIKQHPNFSEFRGELIEYLENNKK